MKAGMQWSRWLLCREEYPSRFLYYDKIELNNLAQQLKRLRQYDIVKITLGDIAHGKNNFRDSR